MMKSQFEKIKEVLTPEQQEKLKAEMEKRRGKRRPGGAHKPEATK